jgi:hypothetical protein
MAPMRYALIVASGRDNVAAYLPGNYHVLHEESATVDDPFAKPTWRHVVIGGRDDAGWTLDGYVLPRLASGLIGGGEIGLEHPIMKRAPDRAPGHTRRQGSPELRPGRV